MFQDWASILLQIDILLINWFCSASGLLFILTDRYCRKPFLLLVVALSPLFFVLCFYLFHIFFLFPSVAFFSSVIFLPSVLLSETFLLCSDSLFITREIWKKNGRGVFPLLHQRRLADIVTHLSKGQNWTPDMHTLTMSALLFFCYYMLLHYSFPGSLGVKIWLCLSCQPSITPS